ncbi:peptidase inhibitor family I36 protein [Microbacterium sp. UFMG61]|uniref:peptidase inhibitor family I36 protein n=1 Tax=Microbacterium sp. UFMG61 TaxID=2745935 RepID=UPI0018905817|nr:peptidase inhibitor family I36 protein [Microbacterium sp. UFMG61]
MRSGRIVTAVVLGVLAAGTLSGAAHAEGFGDEEVATLIVEVMDEVPGGVIIDRNHAVWPELGMTLTVPTRREISLRAAVGSCATGQVCAFTGASLTGAKLSWTTCSTHSIPSSFVTRSIADARSSGYAQARNVTTVLATAAANGWANVSGTATNLRCVL